MCADEWGSDAPGCEWQYGCPDVACNNKKNDRWCFLKENPCRPSGKYQVYLDDDWMKCGDDSFIFGKESKFRLFFYCFRKNKSHY